MIEQPPPLLKPRRVSDALFNFFSGLLVLAIIAVPVLSGLIFLNPRSSLNPLPPPTAVPMIVIETLPLRLTQAPTANAQLTLAPLLSPTAILSSPVGLPGQATQTPTLKVTSPYSFILQSDPEAVDASVISAERGCQWMGVAGQVFDLKNNPVPLGIEVQLAGVLDGKPISVVSLTGTAVIYGASGFEITLAEKPIASRGSLWIRLVDQAGLPLSDRYYFDTYSDCKQNLILINFKQVR